MAHGYAGSGLSVINGVMGIAAGTQTAITGTVVVSDSNGLSFGLSGSTRITASMDALRSVSAGTTQGGTSKLVFADGGGVTFGYNAGTITATVGTAYVTGLGLSTGGNTAGDTGTTIGRYVFAGVGAVSLSQATAAGSLATLSISVPGVPVVSNAIQDVGTATGSGTNTSRFAADDHVHRGVLAVGASGGNTAGDTGSRFGVVVFAGGAGIIVSQATGAVSNTVSVVNSWSTATTASDVASVNAVGANAGRFALEGHQHAGLHTISIVGNTSGTTTAGAGSIVLAGGPNVTLSCSTAAGGMTVSVSGGAGGGGGAAISAGTQSTNAGTVIFSNSNNFTFGMAGSQTITASYTVPVVSNAIQTVGSATGSGTNTSRFAADDHVHAGVAAIAAGSNTGNTLGNTATQVGTWVIAGTGNITISGSTGGAGIHTAWVSGGRVYSSTVFGFDLGKGPTSSSSSLGQNSLYVFPHAAHEYVALSCIKLPIAVTFSSSAAASVQRGHTIRFGVFTRHNTNSTVLTQHYSTSYTFAGSFNSNTSCAMSIITGIGNSTSYNSTTQTSTNGIALSSLVHGVRDVILPWNTTLAPGEYWLGILNSSSSAGAVGNMGWSHMVQISTTGNKMGVAINATNPGIARDLPLGSYSASTGAMPTGISFTQINKSAMMPVIYGFHAITE